MRKQFAANVLVTSSFLLSALLASTSAGATVTYRITELSALSPSGTSIATDINAFGQITGAASSSATGSRFAVTWSATGEISALSSGRVSESAGMAINDSGVVVGFALESSSQRPTIWTNGGTAWLPDPPCCNNGRGNAYDVNNQGVSVGTVDYTALTWTNGTPTALPNLTPNYGSAASAINDRGWVAGHSVYQSNFSTGTHAVVWKDGQVIDLGAAQGFSHSYSTDISESGDVVGYSENNNGTRARATLWRDGHATDLGSLNDGADTSYAAAINDKGLIVGYNLPDPTKFNINTRAVIWGEDLRPVALEDLIDPTDPLYGLFALAAATGLNDAGQIVGHGVLNGQVRGFLLTPVAIPELSTHSMLMLGLGGLCFLVARRSQISAAAAQSPHST